MKQKRIKPRPISPKGSRSCAYPDDYLDYVHDCEMREYKKSDKFKQGQKLIEKFKSKLP